MTGDVTVYAHWTVNSYTLTFDANGGKVSPASRKVRYGAKYGDLPTPTRSGYTFDGWYTAKSGGSKVSGDAVMGAGDVTVYARWAESPRPSSVVMHRLYNRYTGEHFYTSDVSERDRLVSVGWSYEGVGWVAPVSGDPVYRLYNGHVRGGDHHYTTSASERDSLVRAGWSYEGVGWRSGGSVPVYRQYNPYARTGTHNYTADGSENDRLVSVGSGTPVAPSSPVLGSYLRDELALDGADGNLQIDWFDPSRARVTYLWEGVPPWLLHQTSSRRVSGGWDISDRLATYQFRTDNNKAALQELDHYAKSARRLSHS